MGNACLKLLGNFQSLRNGKILVKTNNFVFLLRHPGEGQGAIKFYPLNIRLMYYIKIEASHQNMHLTFGIHGSISLEMAHFIFKKVLHQDL